MSPAFLKFEYFLLIFKNFSVYIYIYTHLPYLMISAESVKCDFYFPIF